METDPTKKEKLLFQIFSHPDISLNTIYRLKLKLNPQPIYLLKTEKEKLQNFFYHLTRGHLLKAIKIYKLLPPNKQKKLAALKKKIIEKIKLSLFLEEPLQYFAFTLQAKNFKTTSDFKLWKKLTLLFGTDKFQTIEKNLQKINFIPPYLKNMILGTFYYQKMNDYKKALKNFIKYYNHDKNNNSLKILIGRCYLNVNFMDEAASFFQAAYDNSHDPIIKKIAYQHLLFIQNLDETF